MYYCLGTTKECADLHGKLPKIVYGELLRGLAMIDSWYGAKRNYLEIGGYSIVADTEEDLCKARERFDDRLHLCEWATKLGNSGYVSALYLLNNEFSVMLYTKEDLVNEDILENLED